MNVKNALDAMTERMFSDHFTNAILAAHKEELEEDACGIYEKEYRAASETLSFVLTEEQKSALAEMEHNCRENINYAVQFAFQRGIYAGFQQCFVIETTARPFEQFVASQILIEPKMRRYIAYYKRRGAFNEIYNRLEDQLEESNQARLLSIYLAWEERLYGALRHAFYMGYRYALAVIGHVEPAAPTAMTPKILTTEYELGFTRTGEEREHKNANAAQARKKHRMPPT